MSLSPNLAFTLLIAGLFGVVGELVYPGRIVPGCAGALAALAGAHWLWRYSPTPVAIALLILSAPLFLLEAAVGTRLICGMLATLAFIGGSAALFPHSTGFSTALALALSIPFCLIMLVLASVADRARRNKRSERRRSRERRDGRDVSEHPKRVGAPS